MSETRKHHTEAIERWLSSYRDDVELFVRVLQSSEPDVSERGREVAAGVLGYQLKKFDLAPDWQPGVGVVDDALVLRIGAKVFFSNNVTELPRELEARLTELREQDALVQQICGTAYEPLYERVRDLREERIQGRLPDEVVRDPRNVAELVEAVERHCKAVELPTAVDEQLLVELSQYLQHRLRGVR